MAHESVEFCGRCKWTIPEQATNCPNCGAWVESATNGEVTGP